VTMPDHHQHAHLPSASPADSHHDGSSAEPVTAPGSHHAVTSQERTQARALLERLAAAHLAALAACANFPVRPCVTSGAWPDDRPRGQQWPECVLAARPFQPATPHDPPLGAGSHRTTWNSLVRPCPVSLPPALTTRRRTAGQDQRGRVPMSCGGRA
jgi:hypothetical protein